MGLLQFLSFNTWSVYLTEGTSNFVIGAFIVAVIMLIIKLWNNILIDIHKNNKVKFPVSLLARTINIGLYILVLSIISLFSMPYLFIGATIAIPIYIGIGAILYGSDDVASYEFALAENKLILKFLIYLQDQKRIRTGKTEIVKNINKRIYEYKNRTVIG